MNTTLIVDRSFLEEQHRLNGHKTWHIRFNCIFLRTFFFLNTIVLTTSIDVNDIISIKCKSGTNAFTDINEMNYEWKHSKELNKTLNCVLCLGSCFLSRLLSLVEDDSGLQYLHIVPLHTHAHTYTLNVTMVHLSNSKYLLKDKQTLVLHYIITTCEHNTRLWNGFRFDTNIQQPNEK